MIERSNHNVLGIYIDAVDYAAAVTRIIDTAKRCQPMAISALAVHGLMTGVMDATHRYRLSQFDLLLPDGQPVRWAMNWLYGVQLPDRVYGPTLMMRVCEQAAAEGLPVFLYGNTATVLDALCENLRRHVPNLKIAGTRPSLFRRLTTSEHERLIADICSSGALITFIGLGCPRQEVWAYECHKGLEMPVVAVGGAFNLHAGALSQAPAYLQRYGLEWLYRLNQEPQRLWKRYALLNPLFLWLLALQWMRLRTFSPEDVRLPTEDLRYG